MESGAAARRRRLLERGSDRLAFITGQARSLPPDPSPDSPLSAVEPASPQLSGWQPGEGRISDDNSTDIVQLQKSVPSDLVSEIQSFDGVRQQSHKSVPIDDKSTDIVQLQKSVPSDLVSEIQPFDGVRQQSHKEKGLSNDGDLLCELKTSSAVPEIQPSQGHSVETASKKTSQVAASVPRREVETRPRYVPPVQTNITDNAAWYMLMLKEHLNYTPQEITKAISATEYNRFLASVIIGFLAVLSNWGLDIGGTITRVLVGTRPLLFLTITIITIVIASLMENKGPNGRGRTAGSSLGSADSLGQILEIGLLLQKALTALLMDYSICAMIMICFLGF